MGFFNPERAQESLSALQMMEFDGRDQMVRQIQQGQTLLNLLQQANMELNALRSALGVRDGMPTGGTAGGSLPTGGGQTIGGAAKAAQTAHGADTTPYGKVLMDRSRPDMSRSSGVAVK